MNRAFLTAKDAKKRERFCAEILALFAFLADQKKGGAQ